MIVEEQPSQARVSFSRRGLAASLGGNRREAAAAKRLGHSYFLPFAGVAAAGALEPAAGAAGAAPFAGAAPLAAPAAGAAAPAAGAAPAAAPSAAAPSSAAAPPPLISSCLRLATFGSPNTLFFSSHFSSSLSLARRSARVSTLRCRTSELALLRLRSSDITLPVDNPENRGEE